MKTTLYIVTLREGSMCLAAGLAVRFHGADAHVTCRDGMEIETFWAQRLAFLRANPNNYTGRNGALPRPSVRR
jgi:hypothetical protein